MPYRLSFVCDDDQVHPPSPHLQPSSVDGLSRSSCVLQVSKFFEKHTSWETAAYVGDDFICPFSPQLFWSSISRSRLVAFYRSFNNSYHDERILRNAAAWLKQELSAINSVERTVLYMHEHPDDGWVTFGQRSIAMKNRGPGTRR